jgi:Predicted membrane protein (DUF2079)
VGVVIPHFNEGEPSDFYGRYDEVGGSALGIVETAVADPLKVLGVAFDGRGVGYVLRLLAPVAFLPLAAPLALLPALPDLALNLLSSARTQTSIHFHYSAPLIPAVFAATIFGAARLRFSIGTPLVVLAVASNVALAAVPIWDLQSGSFAVTAHDRVAASAVELIPGDAVVSASNSLGAQLSMRRRFLSFPILRDAEWVAADETSPGYLDAFAPEPYALALARLRANPRWRIVFEQDGVLVFRWESPAAAGRP